MEIIPLTPSIGAEICGLDLRSGLEAGTIDSLNKALLEHLVLFIRGEPLEPRDLLAFARSFGTIQAHPFAPQHPEHGDLVVLDQVHPAGEGGDAWHSDATFLPEPPGATILQAIRLPQVGGDTCFASMYAAYDALSAPLRALIGRLMGVHDITGPLSQAIENGYSPDNLAEMQQRWPATEHPVARTHPFTGRKALFVNSNYTTRISGLSARESELLLRFLCDHVRSPDFQCRFRWEPGSIAFWDNRCVQHYAVPDYYEQRLMHRLTLEGERPA